MKTATEYTITQKLEALKAHLIENENFTEEEAEALTYEERWECFTCGSWEYKVFTDEEADGAVKKILKRLEAECGAVLRS